MDNLLTHDKENFVSHAINCFVAFCRFFDPLCSIPILGHSWRWEVHRIVFLLL